MLSHNASERALPSIPVGPGSDLMWGAPNLGGVGGGEVPIRRTMLWGGGPRRLE